MSRLSTKTKGLPVTRFYTKPGSNPLDDVRYVKRASRIADADGTLVFEMNDVEVPESWSQLATDILASKYCRPMNGDASKRENSARQVVGRVAGTIRKAGEKGGYFAGAAAAEVFEAELSFLLLNQYAAFNTPVWLNCGLSQAYGLKGQGGNWFVDAATGRAEETPDAYSRPQVSACFIQSLDDSLSSVFELSKNEARIFKYGSGSGTNFSRIRSRHEKLSTGGSSSGLMFFLEVLDKGAGAIKSGGIGRRAAKMVCLDADHPEIEDFIQWKQREEKKVAVLVAAGYDSDFNGEAYRTVSGQNSNNSIRVTDEFMKAVRDDGPWSTTLRTTGKVHETLSARKLMKTIAQAAWSCADPGLQFDTTINRFHTCPNTDRIRGSNPCSEYMFLDDTACNLASLNLVKYLREDGSFDVPAFRHAARLIFLAQEILVGFSSYPTRKIAENTHAYRPLGLGYANLGSLLMIQGLAYDSGRARSWAGALTALMTGEAYCASAEIAASRGAFDGFAANREPMLDVMRLHRAAVDDVEKGCPEDVLDAAQQAWDDALTLGEKHGYRNAQATVLAPTGTIGLLMDCDTTGIEPDFALVKFKKLSGGGTLKIVNGSVEKALLGLGYSAAQAERIVAHVLETGSAEDALDLREEHLPVFDCANPSSAGGRFIAPLGHARMMAAAQPFLSGAISKTINMPHQATVADIESAYIESWKLGLKAVALYRDGCKLSQPLSVTQKKGAAGDAEAAVAGSILERRYLPQKRSGHTVETALNGQKLYIRTGEYPDGRLGEVFLDFGKPGSPLQEMLNCLSISVSLGLQYGVPLQDLVDRLTFTRFEPSGSVRHPRVKQASSVVDLVFRVLGVDYLGRADLAHVAPEPVPAQELALAAAPAANADSADAHLSRLMGDAPFCAHCGHVTVRSGSCYKCLNCGNSMGCS